MPSGGRSGWVHYRLGEVADLLTGFPFKSELYSTRTGDPRLLRGDNIAQGLLRWDDAKRWDQGSTEGLDAYWLCQGDVVVAMDRPWIEAGLKFACLSKADLPALLVQRVARLRGSERIDTGFLRYVIASRAFTNHVLAVQTGTAVPHISAAQIKAFEFFAPQPIRQQRSIARVLEALDDKIELNRRMSQTLEAIAQAIFNSWFVDFDPVRARGAGDNVESMRHRYGVSGRALAYFPSELTDTPAGISPEGWEVGSILDHARLLSGGTPKTNRADYWDGEIQWASAKDVSQCGATFLVSTERSITALGLNESATQLVPAYATAVVARGATTGRMAILGAEMAMNQTCYALATTTSTPITLYLRLKARIEDMVRAAHGSVFDTITTATFRTTPFLKPPIDLMLEFEAVVQPLFQEAMELQKTSLALCALRDSLLPKLLSGELSANPDEVYA